MGTTENAEKQIENRFDRQKDAIWFQPEERVVIIGGIGGIGSWLTLLMSRAGFEPIIYDMDTLEEHNLTGQLLPQKGIGQKKVDAMYQVVKEFSAGHEINVNEEPYDGESMVSRYMFSAFDNMTARKVMFENWKRYVAETGDVHALFMDGRLTFEEMQIFCITPAKIDKYEKYLYNDEDIQEAQCTLKQNSGSASMIAAHMWGFFVNHITNVVEEDTVRDVPFFWQYIIPVNQMTTREE